MGLLQNISTFVKTTKKKSEVMLDENGPKWAILGGAAMLIGAGVLACKQTLKAEEVIEQHKKRELAINTAANDDIYKGEYTVEDAKKDIKADYIKTGVEFIKLYRGPIIMGVVGIGGILWGTNKLDSKVRNLTLSVAAISQAYDEYRKRVASEVGEDREKELYLNSDVQEVIDAETSKAERLVKNHEEELKRNPYIMEFGPQNYDGTTNGVFDRHAPSYNILAVRNALNDAQRELELTGQVWVRDVCKKLGMKCPALYANSGWVVERDEHGKIFAPIGDAKVDFGLVDNVAYYCDAFDLTEEEAGIAQAESIYLRPNCVDIRNYLYSKEKRKFNIV